jgi:hypothetical protein
LFHEYFSTRKHMSSMFNIINYVFRFTNYHSIYRCVYSGRKITELRKRHSKRGKNGKSKMGARLSTVCLSVYSITENIYYSQLSSVAILLQPEPVSHRIIQGQDCVLSPYVLSSCVLSLPPSCLLLTVNEARSYFGSAILHTFIGSHQCA